MNLCTMHRLLSGKLNKVNTVLFHITEAPTQLTSPIFIQAGPRERKGTVMLWLVKSRTQNTYGDHDIEENCFTCLQINRGRYRGIKHKWKANSQQMDSECKGGWLTARCEPPSVKGGVYSRSFRSTSSVARVLVSSDVTLEVSSSGDFFSST